MAPITISCVILTWNSQSYIARCLDSLIASLGTAGFKWEIFVVDNGSTDDTPAILRGYAESNEGNLIPIFLERNFGTTVSRNIALRRARGEYLCVMDSDVEVAQATFPVMVKVLNDDGQVGMVVPKILYPSGKWQKSTDRFPTLLHKINRFFRLRHIEAAEATAQEDDCQRRDVDYAISAFWLFRRNVMEKVGLLDENIFYAPEDVDYCLRIWKRGFRITYFPGVQVVHHTQEISRGFKLNRAKIDHIKGLFYFFWKHRYVFRSPAFMSGEIVRF